METRTCCTFKYIVEISVVYETSLTKFGFAVMGSGFKFSREDLVFSSAEEAKTAARKLIIKLKKEAIASGTNQIDATQINSRNPVFHPEVTEPVKTEAEATEIAETQAEVTINTEPAKPVKTEIVDCTEVVTTDTVSDASLLIKDLTASLDLILKDYESKHPRPLTLIPHGVQKTPQRVSYTLLSAAPPA